MAKKVKLSFVILLGLNIFSLGKISELLLLTKESYCNVDLKCRIMGNILYQNFPTPFLKM